VKSLRGAQEKKGVVFPNRTLCFNWHGIKEKVIPANNLIGQKVERTRKVCAERRNTGFRFFRKDRV
jgi:hypothetical protein